MSPKKTDTSKKAKDLEEKADKLLEKNKDEKAFELYKEALDYNPERIELYDKIISLHEKYTDNWTEDDFAYNLSLSMSKQEIIDPAYKRIHARVTPEFAQIVGIIKKMLGSTNRDNETKFVEEIVSHGEASIYPLIDFLIGFKQAGEKKAKAKKKDPKKTKK